MNCLGLCKQQILNEMAYNVFFLTWIHIIIWTSFSTFLSHFYFTPDVRVNLCVLDIKKRKELHSDMILHNIYTNIVKRNRTFLFANSPPQAQINFPEQSNFLLHYRSNICLWTNMLYRGVRCCGILRQYCLRWFLYRQFKSVDR